MSDEVRLASRAARTWPIEVRLARPEDKNAILPFATTTWGGWDYIPDVWDDWLVARDGLVLVATVGRPPDGDSARDAEGAGLEVGQPIAMTRVTMLSPDEAWLEGIRVDPRVRGLGVATDLQVAELHWIRAHGARMVRYITHESNLGSQRLGARHGLLEVGRWRAHGRHAGHGDDGSPEAALELETTLGRLGRGRPDAWERIAEEPMLAAGGGLYEYRPWAFQELTEARFRAHAERGEVTTITKGDAWAAIIVNRPQLVSHRTLHVAFACGDGEALLDLLLWLGRPPLRLPDPRPPILVGHEQQYADEGYPPSLDASVVVARPIDHEHQVPEPDPERLRFGDRPRAIAEPPSLDPLPGAA
jgi:GNAT superfamily N-acetyltransferase